MAPFLLFFVALATASPLKRQMSAIDADGDGLISRPEVHNVMTLQNALVALDAVDGDHGFTEQETTDFFGDSSLYAQWNTNGDDHLSFGEVHHAITLDGMFDWFDTNGDGFLEGTEADKVVYVYDLMVAQGIHHGNFRSHHHLDADQDGQVSLLEAMNGIDVEQAINALDSNGDGMFTQTQALQFMDHHMFAVLDTNHDHQLSFDEIRTGLTVQDLFNFYDQNDDGFLTGTEVDQMQYIWDSIHGHGNNRMHHELDANGDGQVTQQEATQGIHFNQALHAIDSDGDGSLTQTQALQFLDHHYFNSLDTNHDHELSIDEISAGMTLNQLFNIHDHDNDGVLTGSEADGFQFLWNAVHGHGHNRRQATGIDADGDGLISRPEVHNVMTLQNALVALDAVDGDHGFTEQETTDFFGDSTLYAQWNTNGDDHLSFGEVHHAITLDGMFDWFDTNGDGFLEGAEADKVVYVYDLMVAQGIHHGNFRNHHELDANNDAHISKPEVMNAFTLEQALVALDTNGDMQFTVDDALQFIDHHYFNVLDTNHDHVIDFNEILTGTTLSELFDFYDENSDGFLYGTEADIMIYVYNEIQNSIVVTSPPATADPNTVAPFRVIPRVLDTNNDAHISKPEVLNAFTLEQALVALDTNGDMQFTVDDALQFIDHHYFNVLDTNHDHVIDFNEILTGTTLSELFDFYDENSDGFLYGTEADIMIYIYNEIQNSIVPTNAVVTGTPATGTDFPNTVFF
ncbi:PREDICTED: uncharacterized protein LOC109485733 isoform X4 [Branchiostoma belcheri]|uniref:Uncharacterized protein LOC109485733 isoform X2 n=1 Tax=Branchiostoma belcheri TaxID=7741 RepID=A0A6P4ZUU4_BRABE|nr:PREDICTED: uncharacterized protein LOC109485733 isoform X2 [Branchiostoma belcheri]XP_019644964.1 PREDICTED: uncharacterized protein LOC109485733 isoform X3 [Branchiostoma belcheri]XP_019644965.1 PREDICTED: uncharacterized protein LOC109485733 isoform X4 [Branchiostoma belcheri]